MDWDELKESKDAEPFPDFQTKELQGEAEDWKNEADDWKETGDWKQAMGEDWKQAPAEDWKAAGDVKDAGNWNEAASEESSGWEEVPTDWKETVGWETDDSKG
jgi:hypothetical protein